MLLLLLPSLISVLLRVGASFSAGNFLIITKQDLSSIPLKICNNTFIILELSADDSESLYVLKYTSTDFVLECAFPNGDAIRTDPVIYFVSNALYLAAWQFSCPTYEGIYACNVSESHTVIFGIYSSSEQCASTHGELIGNTNCQ